MRDPAEDVKAAIRQTERLIRDAEGDTDDGKEKYVADLKRHLEKLNDTLAKHEERKKRDEGRYGMAS